AFGRARRAGGNTRGGGVLVRVRWLQRPRPTHPGPGSGAAPEPGSDAAPGNGATFGPLHGGSVPGGRTFGRAGTGCGFGGGTGPHRPGPGRTPPMPGSDHRPRPGLPDPRPAGCAGWATTPA